MILYDYTVVFSAEEVLVFSQAQSNMWHVFLSFSCKKPCSLVAEIMSHILGMRMYQITIYISYSCMQYVTTPDKMQKKTKNDPMLK